MKVLTAFLLVCAICATFFFSITALTLPDEYETMNVVMVVDGSTEVVSYDVVDAPMLDYLEDNQQNIYDFDRNVRNKLNDISDKANRLYNLGLDALQIADMVSDFFNDKAVDTSDNALYYLFRSNQSYSSFANFLYNALTSEYSPSFFILSSPLSSLEKALGIELMGRINLSNPLLPFYSKDSDEGCITISLLSKLGGDSGDIIFAYQDSMYTWGINSVYMPRSEIYVVDDDVRVPVYDYRFYRSYDQETGKYSSRLISSKSTGQYYSFNSHTFYSY